MPYSKALKEAQKRYRKAIKTVTFVCSPNFYEQLQEAAQANNQTVSGFIKLTLFNAINEMQEKTRG